MRTFNRWDSARKCDSQVTFHYDNGVSDNVNDNVRVIKVNAAAEMRELHIPKIDLLEFVAHLVAEERAAALEGADYRQILGISK
jgi:hypothetical protein